MRHRHQPAEHLPSLPPMPPPAPTMLRLNDAGAVIDLPVPVLRRDAYCWAATMWPDPAQPGGWGRACWWDVRMGRPGYQPVALEYADLIEFGADLPVGTGRHASWFPVRWYGILLSTSRWELVAHGGHPTPAAAQRVAQELRSSLAYRLIGHIELASPPSARPAPRRQLYLQEPAYRPSAP
jgi:hypothetical protein